MVRKMGQKIEDELWHDCQRQRLGDAWNREEQARREAEAHRVEIQWRQSE